MEKKTKKQEVLGRNILPTFLKLFNSTGNSFQNYNIAQNYTILQSCSAFVPT
jgi:hypothetical protein